jgi:hypothetical protein
VEVAQVIQAKLMAALAPLEKEMMVAKVGMVTRLPVVAVAKVAQVQTIHAVPVAVVEPGRLALIVEHQ